MIRVGRRAAKGRGPGISFGKDTPFVITPARKAGDPINPMMGLPNQREHWAEATDLDVTDIAHIQNQTHDHPLTGRAFGSHVHDE